MKPSNYITSRTPVIGDWVLLDSGKCGLVLDYSTTEEGMYYVLRLDTCESGLYEFSQRYKGFIVTNENITNLLAPISKPMFLKLCNIAYKFIEDNHMDEYDEYTTAWFSKIFDVIDDLYKGKLTHQVSDVILSNGIKKVLKHKKGTGNRIVLLGNDEVWEVHRCKFKTSARRSRAIAQYTQLKRVSNHTSFYKLIKKIC